jgi:hypothetical protein
MNMPGFTAEASLDENTRSRRLRATHPRYGSYSRAGRRSAAGQHSRIDSRHVSPQVMEDPSRPRPPVIVKGTNCAVICFYFAGRYRCSVVC